MHSNSPVCSDKQENKSFAKTLVTTVLTSRNGRRAGKKWANLYEANKKIKATELCEPLEQKHSCTFSSTGMLWATSRRENFNNTQGCVLVKSIKHRHKCFNCSAAPNPAHCTRIHKCICLYRASPFKTLTFTYFYHCCCDILYISNHCPLKVKPGDR